MNVKGFFSQFIQQIKRIMRYLMKTLCIILAALICLPILVFAVPDSMVTGSDNSSFDLF